MQQALGKQWDQLHKALQLHYQNTPSGKNIAEGRLNIDYPRFMQWPLNFLRLMGGLVNRRGNQLSTTVSRTMDNGRQYWHRTIGFSDGKSIHFKSQFIYHSKTNELIEFINPFIGMKMRVYVKNGQLHYRSTAYVIKLGKSMMSIPEYLSLGYASIIETAGDDNEFEMEFNLKHPLFGEIFSYAGKFRTIEPL
jgi:hypothetical protein